MAKRKQNAQRKADDGAVSEALALHDDAMASTDLAFQARARGDRDEALRQFETALEFEARAVESLPQYPESELTKSILYRSAATLAIDCGRMDEAKRFANAGLQGNPPKDIADELRALIKNGVAEPSAPRKPDRVSAKEPIDVIREAALTLNLDASFSWPFRRAWRASVTWLRSLKWGEVCIGLLALLPGIAFIVLAASLGVRQENLLPLIIATLGTSSFGLCLGRLIEISRRIYTAQGLILEIRLQEGEAAAETCRSLIRPDLRRLGIHSVISFLSGLLWIVVAVNIISYLQDGVFHTVTAGICAAFSFSLALFEVMDYTAMPEEYGNLLKGRSRERAAEPSLR